ncbi:conserved Plasmodium protein, unknown function [Plasmodium berghei]|uniref:Uncharacterized protein n=2 Tax=Plasmodium berghei TaxID=5821 RepID=A0A509ASJ2_PLABA|nr:conserved protein, unknown function [Plasmodium berghei ANKA]CXJ25087.1 conserved Plasmodium protein, unknown function [Plasmodium berghei]SCM26843.1 conserved Plasmodium protein, unknown function [Plasmodium berghei]SCN28664.1 conserved Plasmodium protein, unknown function [Plasmodium berghei]SCO62884.1 conserved Plasmodium protein, unknown function [Plasmodium berghei]SCO64412.1 conserved Plasmodium protein, unknown function [Plasmodium berghei]|eukprot:XP_034424309.1 conserved protein, unknown function [Plasmodium berghei ANKA]
MPKKLNILKAKLPKAPPGRRPIGYRGNHKHGKALYDPVYPTSKIPSSLVPRYPLDWRNGGRFLLCVGLRRIENRIINKMKESLNYNIPECSTCNNTCIKIYNRCLCAWYCKYKYRHVYDCDNILMEYKGEINTDKPIFTIKKQVAKKNISKGIEYVYNKNISKFQTIEKNDIYAKFYKKIQEKKQTCSKEEAIYSDSDATDSDEEEIYEDI